MVKTKRAPELLPAKLLRAASSGSGIRLSNGEVRRLLIQFPDVERAGREAAGDAGGLAPGVGPIDDLPEPTPYAGPQLVTGLLQWAERMKQAADAVQPLAPDVAGGNREVADLLTRAAAILGANASPLAGELCKECHEPEECTARNVSNGVCRIVESMQEPPKPKHDEPRILNLGAALAAASAMRTADAVAAADVDEEESW